MNVRLWCAGWTEGQWLTAQKKGWHDAPAAPGSIFFQRFSIKWEDSFLTMYALNFGHLLSMAFKTHLKFKKHFWICLVSSLCKETSQISGNLLCQSPIGRMVGGSKLSRDDSALDFPFFGSGIMLMTIDDYMKANIFCCAQLQLQSFICWRGSSVAQQSSNIKGERAQAVGPSRPDFAVLSDAKYVQYPVLEGHKMSLMTVDVGFYCNHRIGFSNRKPKVSVD